MFRKNNGSVNKGKYNNLENVFTSQETRENYLEKMDKITLEKECMTQLSTYDKLVNIIEKQRHEINEHVNYYNNEIEKIINHYKNQIEELNNQIEEYKAKYEELHTIDTLSEYYLCNICCVNPKNLIFSPCNHFSMCDMCYFNFVALAKEQNIENNEYDNNDVVISNPIIKCPICRMDVKDVKNIFY
jgi:hypothetical protein